MHWRRYLRAMGPLLLLTLGGAYAVASINWCGPWAQTPAQLVSSASSTGQLHAGAASVPLEVPYPVVVAGYPPRRPMASFAHVAPKARALVLAVGAVRVGLVSVDLLTVPEPLYARIKEQIASLKLEELWVGATHAHSSMGGYDSQWVAQLAGTGAYSTGAADAVVAAAAQALTAAAASLTPSHLELGTGAHPELVRARNGGAAPEGRLLRAVFRSEQGPVAQLLLVEAHPTLVPRGQRRLDADYPGRLAQGLEQDGAGVSLVFQSAVGNSSAQAPEGSAAEKVDAYATALVQAFKALPSLASTGPLELSVARASVALPRPDSSRLSPQLLRKVGDNVLCGAASRTATLSALRLGPLGLLSIPGEPTAGVASYFRELTGPGPALVSLVNGYLGYVELSPLVSQGAGESRRQYFEPALAERLGEAARLAARKAGFP